ncbi:hypothetical protein [uncultured Xylophilus sp.]|jgi:hypothetical protein|uniref:hypothetical protein n=1 Tax=uncultured Xylophilus sp. TaxID=296832 RepID=UPI0010D887A8|nr:hypothetical protein [uncultured Xylophilus sp.]RYH66956.1 MAG: hypothetical protein EON54_04580 [Alcaligenaceae bacterium]
MPTTVVLPGARRIWLEVIQGVVLEASSSSVAVIKQGRDQSQLVGGTAIRRPGRISSEIVSIHKVWIREGDGQESAYDLSDFPVDSRPGHSLALVYGAAEGVEQGQFFGARNITTGKYNFDDSIHCDRLAPFGLYLAPRFYRKRVKWGLIVGAVAGLVGLLFGGDFSIFVGGVILGFVFSLPVMVVQGVIKQIQGQRLVPELNRRASELLLSKSRSDGELKL